MKKFYAVLITCLFHFYSLTQNYIPFPENNAVWIQASYLYFGYNGHEHATLTESLAFLDDSTHNMTNYHTLSGNQVAEWIDGWGSQQNYQTGIDYGAGDTILIRQDVAQKQVFIWSNSDNQEVLLYDFNDLIVGQPYPETYTNMNYPQLLVMAHDSVLLDDGLYHEEWILGTNSSDSGFVSVIEGIGSTMGFDLPMTLPFEQSSAILCFSVNESSIYDTWSNQPGLIPAQFSENCKANLSINSIDEGMRDIQVFPNPVSNKFAVSSTELIEEVEIYDFTGRLIWSVHGLMNSVIEISSENFESGNYFVRLKLHSGELVKTRFVK